MLWRLCHLSPWNNCPLPHVCDYPVQVEPPLHAGPCGAISPHPTPPLIAPPCANSGGAAPGWLQGEHSIHVVPYPRHIPPSHPTPPHLHSTLDCPTPCEFRWSCPWAPPRTASAAPSTLRRRCPRESRPMSRGCWCVHGGGERGLGGAAGACMGQGGGRVMGGSAWVAVLGSGQGFSLRRVADAA